MFRFNGIRIVDFRCSEIRFINYEFCRTRMLRNSNFLVVEITNFQIYVFSAYDVQMYEHPDSVFKFFNYIFRIIYFRISIFRFQSFISTISLLKCPMIDFACSEHRVFEFRVVGFPSFRTLSFRKCNF